MLSLCVVRRKQSSADRQPGGATSRDAGFVRVASGGVVAMRRLSAPRAITSLRCASWKGHRCGGHRRRHYDRRLRGDFGCECRAEHRCRCAHPPGLDSRARHAAPRSRAAVSTPSEARTGRRSTERDVAPLGSDVCGDRSATRHGRGAGDDGPPSLRGPRASGCSAAIRRVRRAHRRRARSGVARRRGVPGGGPVVPRASSRHAVCRCSSSIGTPA